MSILAATILAAESARLREAAIAQLWPADKAVRAGTAAELFAALVPLRALIADTARQHAAQLSASELIEVQTTLHEILDQQLACALAQWLTLHTQELTAAAQRDSLTGLPNRAAFEQRLQEETARAHRYERALALVLFDIDYFKLINDRGGHLAGDEALRRVARVLQSSLRQSDAVFRYGGDEFAAICPETGGAVMARISARLEEKLRPGGELGHGKALSISWGLAAWPSDARTATELLRIADARLYVCKQEHHRRAAAHARSFSDE